MKRKIFTLFFIISLGLLNFNAFSQCEPLTPEQCPDPENNGEVCPDSLEVAFLNQFYSQVATIKPPAIAYIPPDSIEINLHHVKLMGVGNLPGGLTWQSNAADSIFIAGEYYCVLMEGQPDSAGIYPLRITIDVYAIVLPGFPPIKVATVTDSTSLSIEVVDDSGIKSDDPASIAVRQNMPNPFQTETRIGFYSDKSRQVTFEVYSSQGKRIHFEKQVANKGENFLTYNGQLLSPGMYFYLIKSDGYRSSGIMIKSGQ